MIFSKLCSGLVKIPFVTGGNELMDGEAAVPLIFPTDFDINKLWKNGTGVQVLFIDSSQVSCHLDTINNIYLNVCCYIMEGWDCF